MGRMHSRGKGISASALPYKRTPPSWLKISTPDFVLLAGWIAGVGGKETNPIWELAQKANLRTCFSDYSNVRYNIYDQGGKIFPSGVAAESYKKAIDAAIEVLIEFY